MGQGEEPGASGDGACHGGVRMTTVGRLLIRKRDLIARLRRNPGPQERDEIDSLLKKINTAFYLLGVAQPDTSPNDD